MLSFKEFLLEGGNVQIGEFEADRIDLSKLDRSLMITRINRLLQAINLRYQKQHGLPLWNPELFASKKFLSGSAFHFFNKAIPSEVFAKYKKSVGDIDTQVDKAQEANIKQFLNSLVGEKIGYATFVGFKESAGQFITLWNFSNPSINLQIDAELVDFVEGKPTEWSEFSHSSAWEDMKEGIKGVFQKYLLRALTTKTLREIIILSGKKETPKKVMSTDLAFSVTQGLRQKLEPVMDGNKQREIDGLLVFKEIPTKESTYVNDLKMMFKILFEKEPSKSDMQSFNSFVGCLGLVKKYFNQNEQKTLILGFAHTLFGPGAQGLYRGNAELDYKEKMIAFKKMVDTLDVSYDKSTIDKMRVAYYENYK